MHKFGRVFKRGRIYWIQYSVRGKQYRESSKSVVKDAAKRLLLARLGEIATGRPVASLLQRTTFDDLVQLLKQDYEINGRKSIADLRYRIGHLRPHFEKRLASEITHDTMLRYIVHRRAQDVAPATIQHELAALSRMLTLAVRDQRIATKPPIPSIELRNARTGYFCTEEVERVCAALKPSLAAVVRFAYLTGWRRSEILSLEWRCVDSAGVRLEPGTTKNDEGRVCIRSQIPSPRS